MTALLGLALVDLALGTAWMIDGAAASRWFGVLHLGLTLCAFVVVNRNWRRKLAASEGQSLIWNPWEWTGLVLPLGAVLGAPGIVLFLGLRAGVRSALRKGQGANPGNSTAPSRPRPRDKRLTIARLLDDRIRFPSAHKVEPLARILKHGDLESRCAALQTVVRSFEPRLTPLIAMALSDPDQTVRALAAATSAQVSANLGERVASMEAEPALRLQDQYEFAMLLFEHGFRNVLLSQTQAAILCNKARASLATVLNSPELDEKHRKAAAAALAQLNGGQAGGQSGGPGGGGAPPIMQLAHTVATA